MAERLVRVRTTQGLPVYINPAAVTHITVSDEHVPSVHFTSGGAVTVEGDVDALLHELFPAPPESATIWDSDTQNRRAPEGE